MKTVLFAALLLAVTAVPSSVEAARPLCVTTLDDMVSDGGSTYCVLYQGCVVYESREYIWGRETYCYP